MAYPTQSVLLNGTTQYYTRAKTGSTNQYATGAQDFTWEAPVKFTALPASGSLQTLYSQSWKTGGNLSFLISVKNNAGTYNYVVVISNDGTNVVNLSLGTLTLVTGTWYYLAVSYQASTGTVTVYQGNNSSSTISTLATNSTYPTTIYNGTDDVVMGAEGDFSNKFNGRFGQTRFWLSLRTAAQITQNWCKELGATSTLGGEWTFDNVSTDNSGNGNSLTPVAGPTFAADVPSFTCSVANNTSSFLAFM